MIFYIYNVLTKLSSITDMVFGLCIADGKLFTFYDTSYAWAKN